MGDASFSKISAISAWEKPRSNPRDFRGLAFLLYHHREKVAFPRMVLSMGTGSELLVESRNTMLTVQQGERLVDTSLDAFFEFIVAKRLLTPAHINR